MGLTLLILVLFIVLVVLVSLGVGLLCIIFIGPQMKRLFKMTTSNSNVIKDPIPGTLLVTSRSYPIRTALYSNCTIIGVIKAKDIPALPFHREMIVHRAKWPQVGGQLPIVIDRQDHNRINILWDQVEDLNQQAMWQAQEMADTMNKSV